MTRKIIVLKPFVICFQRNETRIEAGTALRDAGDGYLGFDGELQLLLDPDAVARLIAAAIIADGPVSDGADVLQAAE